MLTLASDTSVFGTETSKPSDLVGLSWGFVRALIKTGGEGRGAEGVEGAGQKGNRTELDTQWQSQRHSTW